MKEVEKVPSMSQILIILEELKTNSSIIQPIKII